MTASLKDFDWLAEREIERAHIPEPQQSPGDMRSPFERDRARIIHSVAFRRLQGKTQIFASGWGDFLRTRVTHSIEVAQIGRALAQRFGVPDSLVEAACLGHDLGHPPFGHTGETVLNELMKEYGGFEGNAQSFRIVTRLEVKATDYEGLDLCRATLLSLIKYPYRSDAGYSKYLYEDDAQVYDEWLYSGSGRSLLRTFEPTTEPPRTLPCQLMDWADDIAYSVHDLEDGIVTGFLAPRLWTDDYFVDAIFGSLGAAPIRWKTPPTRADVEKVLGSLAARFGKYGASVPRDVIREFARAEIDRFVTECDVDRVGSGETLFDYSLTVPEEHRLENLIMKAITFEFVIRDSRTTTLGFKGREVLRRIFEALFDNALGEPSSADRHVLFPRELRDELASYGDDAHHVARYVCDYVASMTEGQAMGLYRRLFEPSAGFAVGV